MKTFVGYSFVLLLCFTCPNVKSQKGVNGPPPPEVIIEDIPQEKPSRIEYVSNAPVEVLTNPENIGDIEMEVEVHEVRPDKKGAPELVMKNQVNEHIMLQAAGVNGTDPGNATTDASGAVNASDTASSESGSSEFPITDAPTDGDGAEGSKKEATIWPIILLALLFIFLAIFGICWAVTAFCATVNEPLVIETAEFADAEGGGGSGGGGGGGGGAAAAAAAGGVNDDPSGAAGGAYTDAASSGTGGANDDAAGGAAVENDVPPSNRPPSIENAEN